MKNIFKIVFTAIERHLIQSLEEIREDLRTVIHHLQSIRRSGGVSDASIAPESSELPEGITLPVTTVDQLQSLQELLHDEATRCQLVRMFLSHLIDFQLI